MRDAEPLGLRRVLSAAGRFLLRVPLPLALLLALLWALLIFDLSSHRVPFPTRTSLPWEFLSNLAHAPLFGFLTLFVAAVVLRERDGAWPRPNRLRCGLVFLLVLVYGVLDELHQSSVPGRDASVLDVLTDAVSAGAVLVVVYAVARPELAERALLGRLALGLVACLASAGLALLS